MMVSRRGGGIMRSADMKKYAENMRNFSRTKKNITFEHRIHSSVMEFAAKKWKFAIFYHLKYNIMWSHFWRNFPEPNQGVVLWSKENHCGPHMFLRARTIMRLILSKKNIEKYVENAENAGNVEKCENLGGRRKKADRIIPLVWFIFPSGKSTFRYAEYLSCPAIHNHCQTSCVLWASPATSVGAVPRGSTTCLRVYTRDRRCRAKVFGTSFR